MKSTELIARQIKEIPVGVIFDYTALGIPVEMQSAGVKALSRMVATNRLRRAGKGRFYKPAYSALGEMCLPPDELTKDLLVKNGERIGYVTGVPAFARFGLTTQISSKILIGSRTYRRSVERGGYEISFTRQENKITSESIPLLRFLDAIRFINKIPACTPDRAVTILSAWLSKFTKGEIDRLNRYIKSYPPSARAVFGAMLENQGIESSEVYFTLNPLSYYKIGISDRTLPNKSKWHIQ